MTRFRSLNAIKSYLGAQARERESPARTGRRPATGRFVTISRQAGAGGTTVADHLARILNREREPAEIPWTVFDKNLVKHVLEEHGLPERLARFLKEDHLTDLHEVVEGLLGGQPSRRSLVAKTSRTILHMATMGNAIVVGRAGNVVTRHLEGGLRVRLIGSPERRLVRLREFYGFAEGEAAGALKKSDSGRKSYVRRYFREDIEDPLRYDLVVNTDQVPYLHAARLIATALEFGTGRG
ncbi:MAG: cytidylate kinase-like family protein [Planctomycetota bacterium]|jgi:cytidylate kinase